jgi:hypothetical protein
VNEVEHLLLRSRVPVALLLRDVFELGLDAVDETLAEVLSDEVVGLPGAVEAASL